ncbi:SEC16A family protein [Megaselia abdita]
MSFSPNPHQQTGAYFTIPSHNNNSQQDNTNTNYNQTGSSRVEQVGGGNNWLMQQNWQQQPQQNQQQQSNQPFHQLPAQSLQFNPPPAQLQPQSFFDNIPGSPHNQPVPQIRNNNLESNTVDGWGEWDDWSHHDNKSIINHPISESFLQSKPEPISSVSDPSKNNDNWQWQQLSTTPNANQSDYKTEAPCLPKIVPPPSFQSPQISKQSYSRPSQHRPNNDQPPIFSTSLTQPASLLVPTVTNIYDNQELGVPENLEVFERSKITLLNSQNNQSSYITSAPQMFQNYTKREEISENQLTQNIVQDNPPLSQESIINTSNLNHQQSPVPLLISSSVQVQQSANSVISPPQHEFSSSGTVFSKNTTSIVPDSLEDRDQFLNQEDHANERDRFLSQSDGPDNLLPPPAAYQQQPTTANDDRNQYLQTSHLSEDDFVVLSNPSNDDDVNLPPPGLSRFVLGEPEQLADSERHADGEDDDAIQPAPTNLSSETSRNLYSFPPPMDLQVQRVVTGLESMTMSQPPVTSTTQQVESREIDLDGENIEDQQPVVKQIPREEPTIGGDPSSNELDIHIQTSANPPDVKNLSNSSTGNESDHHHRNDSKKYSSRSGKGRKRFDSDDSEGSSERERLRHKEKEKKDKRRNTLRDSDEGEFYRQKNLRKREEKQGPKNRYDDSRYETEESTRYDRNGKKLERKDRDRKYDDDFKRGVNNRRSHRVGDRGERRGDRDNRERSDRERNYQEDNRNRRRSDQQYHRNYDDGYQNYNRKNNNSRNARDSDYEKDSRYRMYNMYGGYNYDPYAYYHQHQQYFEQLRKTNPQSYAEWYRKYYSQMQGDAMSGVDCRESVHSGRSSAAGHDKDRPESMSNLDGRSIVQGEDNLQPGRLTPHKFSNDHAVISLVSGVLVSVKPKYSHSTGLQNIVKLIKFAPNDSCKKMFQSFPGPLVKGITHKKTVIEYCEERIKMGPISSRLRSYQSSSNSLQSLGSQQPNQSSYVLLWNLLILLLRQNGVVVGTDIAELLVKNQKLFPYGTLSKRNSIENEAKESSESNTSEVGEDDVNESTQVSSDEKSQLTDEEITDKFRNYLLYGNVNEALEWATDNNLWGHALFLASKVDKRLHANVMMKFANKLNLNDPLQTLYQLMSGRCPSSVTSVQDEKWGDWRPHLAMIISNTTQSPELNRKAITSLGDSLLNRGDLFAAQFCYLMAQVGFGKFSSAVDSLTSVNMIRLVLLGSSHIKSNSFLEFATNEAIIMTEIYEYACSLNDDAFSIIEFQPYKLLISCSLLDYGFHLKALMYLEQISVHIQKHSSRYEDSFINKVYELADKLKFYDPAMEKTFADTNEGIVEDQEWLTNLRTLRDNNQFSSEFQTQYDTLNYNHEKAQQPSFDNNYQPSLGTVIDNANQNVDQLQKESQKPEINYEQDQRYIVTNNEIPSVDSYSNYYQPLQQAEIQPDESQQTQALPFDNQERFQPESSQTTFGGTYDYYNQNTSSQQSYDQTAIPSISMPNSGGGGPKRSIFDDEDYGNKTGTRNTDGQEQVGNKLDSQKNSQQQKGGNPSTQTSGWFGGIWNKFSGKPKNQMILPDDKNPTIVWDADKKKWINTDEGEDSQESFVPPPKMAELVPQLQKQHQQQQDLLKEQPQPRQPQSATIPTTGLISTSASIDPQVNSQVKSSGLQSNMFKMQRNRTLKKSYVDVFNPSGASTKSAENIMAPSLPPLPQSGFMVPSVGDVSQNQPQGVSHFKF